MSEDLGSAPPLESAEDARLAAERALEMVRRMAIYGPGPGTTEAQTLATIAAFIEKRLRALRSAYGGQVDGQSAR